MGNWGNAFANPSALEDMLMVVDLPKVLLVMYKELFKRSPVALTKCRECWEGEVPDIEEEEWDDMWDQPFKHLVSARDRLIHFKFLHRIDFTPARLAVIYPSVSSECWRYGFSPADAKHIFWECPQIKTFGEGGGLLHRRHAESAYPNIN